MQKVNVPIPPKPSGFTLAVMRAPAWFYRLGLGWLLGKRFLMITHTGRRTGTPRRTVLEVIRYSETDDTFYVVSAWGVRADWYRNILKSPSIRLHSGNRQMDALAERLPTGAAERELRSYAGRHPRAMKIIVNRIGYRVALDDKGYSRLAAVLPVVAIRPFVEE